MRVESTATLCTPATVANDFGCGKEKEIEERKERERRENAPTVLVTVGGAQRTWGLLMTANENSSLVGRDLSGKIGGFCLSSHVGFALKPFRYKFSLKNLVFIIYKLFDWLE